MQGSQDTRNMPSRKNASGNRCAHESDKFACDCAGYEHFGLTVYYCRQCSGHVCNPCNTQVGGYTADAYHDAPPGDASGRL